MARAENQCPASAYASGTASADANANANVYADANADGNENANTSARADDGGHYHAGVPCAQWVCLRSLASVPMT